MKLPWNGPKISANPLLNHGFWGMFSIRGKGLAPFAELFLHSDKLKPVAAIVLRLGVVSCNAQREVCRTYSTPRMQVFKSIGIGILLDCENTILCNARACEMQWNAPASRSTSAEREQKGRSSLQQWEPCWFQPWQASSEHWEDGTSRSQLVASGKFDP